MKKVKQKTHKGTVKRLKLTGTGKVTRNTRRNRVHVRLDNVDKKSLQLSKVESKKVKKLIA